MSDDESNREAIEKLKIQSVVSKSIIARDSGQWERLSECYHPGATVSTSWFTGTPAEFVRASQTMKIARHAGESQKHLTSNFWIELKGERAVSECDLILYQRRLIEGREIDLATWSRRLDLLEQHEKAWRIWRIALIYEKDRIEPARPGTDFEEFYKSIDFSRYPAEVRHHCWRNDTIGFPPSPKIALKGGAREAEVRAEAERWLNG